MHETYDLNMLFLLILGRRVSWNRCIYAKLSLVGTDFLEASETLDNT